MSKIENRLDWVEIERDCAPVSASECSEPEAKWTQRGRDGTQPGRKSYRGPEFGPEAEAMASAETVAATRPPVSVE